MTNLLKSYKGQDHIIYPARDEEDAESNRKWENILANFKDEGKYLYFLMYIFMIYLLAYNILNIKFLFFFLN